MNRLQTGFFKIFVEKKQKGVEEDDIRSDSIRGMHIAHEACFIGGSRIKVLLISFSDYVF